MDGSMRHIRRCGEQSSVRTSEGRAGVAGRASLKRGAAFVTGVLITALLAGLSCGCSTPDSSRRSASQGSFADLSGTSFHERNMGSRLWQETKEVFSSKDNLKSLGLAAAVSVGLMATVDRPVEDFMEDDKPLEGLEPVGDFMGYAVPVALILGTRAYGELSDDSELLKTSSALTDAALLTFLYGEGLVTAFGRERPRGGKGNTHFEPFGQPGNRSFPMIHPAVMNSQFKVLSELYPDNTLFKPCVRYPIVGMVAYLRVEKGSHWVSDILPGIVLSEVVGKEVARLYSGKKGNKSWSVVPFPGGVALYTTF